MEWRCLMMATETRRDACEVTVSIVDGNRFIHQATAVSQSKMVAIKLSLPALRFFFRFQGPICTKLTRNAFQKTAVQIPV
jgi:hypothetical protein